MKDLEREYLILWIANDHSAMLAHEMPAQSEAYQALMAEIECACSRWLDGSLWNTNMTDTSKLRKVPKLTRGQIALHCGISENARLFSLAAAVRAMRPAMTEPHQRTRALLKTIRFLESLADPTAEPPVPYGVQVVAIDLLKDYPTLAEIELIHRALPGLFDSVIQRQAEGMPAPRPGHGKKGKAR